MGGSTALLMVIIRVANGCYRGSHASKRLRASNRFQIRIVGDIWRGALIII